MRILITGGAGFIGCHLCEYLLAEGNSVICMDNLLTGSMENIKSLTKDGNFKFINKNVSEHIDIDGKIDYILHFASPASPVDYLNYPIQTLKVGSLGTHNVLGLAKAKGAKFLLASTSEVYGDPLIHPQPETYWGNVSCIGPRGVYDEAKRFAEAITMAYHRVHKIDTRIIRIFNTYGDRMRVNDGRAIPAFISQALKNKPLTVFGDGSQTRSFCYVSDLVNGIFCFMKTPFAYAQGMDYHEPVNLGNPNEMTLLQLAEKIIELTGSKSKIIFEALPVDDPKVRRPDISRAKKLLKWEPEVGLEEGLTRTIEWFKGNIKK